MKDRPGTPTPFGNSPDNNGKDPNKPYKPSPLKRGKSAADIAKENIAALAQARKEAQAKMEAEAQAKKEAECQAREKAKALEEYINLLKKEAIDREREYEDSKSDKGDKAQSSEEKEPEAASADARDDSAARAHSLYAILKGLVRKMQSSDLSAFARMEHGIGGASIFNAIGIQLNPSDLSLLLNALGNDQEKLESLCRVAANIRSDKSVLGLSLIAERGDCYNCLCKLEHFSKATLDEALVRLSEVIQVKANEEAVMEDVNIILSDVGFHYDYIQALEVVERIFHQLKANTNINLTIEVLRKTLSVLGLSVEEIELVIDFFHAGDFDALERELSACLNAGQVDALVDFLNSDSDDGSFGSEKKEARRSDEEEAAAAAAASAPISIKYAKPLGRDDDDDDDDENTSDDDTSYFPSPGSSFSSINSFIVLKPQEDEKWKEEDMLDSDDEDQWEYDDEDDEDDDDDDLPNELSGGGTDQETHGL
ncbi:MAG: hypothetical protein K0T99_00260 [Alphaproteobacteria bacterium]|nr:hypothetical protein [Alphaproteobacteria bacterium]